MRPILAVTVAASTLGLAVVWFGGCSSSSELAPPPPVADVGETSVPDTKPDSLLDVVYDTTTVCTEAKQGCACPAPGALVECKVYRTSGDYVSCSYGNLHCGDDLRWGPCDADGVWTPDAGSDVPG